MAGGDLNDSFWPVSASGLSPYDTLLTATRNPAIALGQADQYGQVAVGFRANLMVLKDNPLQSIAALETLQGLVINGRYHDDKGLAVLRARARVTDYSRTRDRVARGPALQGTEL